MSLWIVVYALLAVVHLPLVYKVMLDGEKLSDQVGFYLFTYVVLIPFYSVVWPAADALVVLWIACMLLAEGVRWTAKRLNV
jgi:hypothetical protein